MTTVLQLIEKLQTYDPNLEVTIEPSIDCVDADIGDQMACDIIDGSTPNILLRVSQAQSYQFSPDDGCEEDEDDKDFGFDIFVEPTDKKDVLVISSEALKYGEGI